VNWEQLGNEKELVAFVRRLIALRQNHPVFRRRNFFQGRSIKGAGIKDILWLRPDGREMPDEEWNQEHARTLGLFLSGSAVDEIDERGQLITDENFLLLMNAHHEEVPFTIPTAASGMMWNCLVDTSFEHARSPGTVHEPMTTYPLQSRSLALLVERQREQVRQDRRNGA
jgi:glycogen operon protein